jgi:phosphoribosylformylglycinamidine cyclo-ligase
VVGADRVVGMSDAYGRAGVDLDAAGRAVALIRDLAGQATRPEVIEGVGGFAGLFRVSEDRLLAAATDGVGTKLDVALAAGRLHTIGVDLVAMCADDVVCTGAEPLFFLDYVAMGRLVPENVAAIVAGVAEGCRRAGCALLGGETAEHPVTMRPEELDLAGFCVGVVDERSMLGPHRVHEGDVLIGLASTGLHANGYSLVRKALLEDGGYRLDDVLPRLGRSLGDELLEPTAIYTPLVLDLARDGVIHAAAHVTGGGLVENIPRVMPAGLHADIDWRSWPVPAVFDLVAEASNAGDEELRRTFNLGVGMALVAPAQRIAEVISRGKAGGFESFEIGRVVRA